MGIHRDCAIIDFDVSYTITSRETVHTVSENKEKTVYHPPYGDTPFFIEYFLIWRFLNCRSLK